MTKIRALLSAKLGRCPRCMRLSAKGTAVGWGIWAILWLYWPEPVLLALALVAAGSFTLVMLAHLVAFTVRWVRALSEARSQIAEQSLQAYNPARRQFLRDVFSGGVTFFTLVLARWLPASANTCPGLVRQAGGGTADACDPGSAAFLSQKAAGSFCIAVCSGFVGACDPSLTCLPRGALDENTIALPISGVPNCPGGRGFRGITTVSGCLCGCFRSGPAPLPECPPRIRLIVPVPTLGTGTTRLEARNNFNVQVRLLCDPLCLPNTGCAILQRCLTRPADAVCTEIAPGSWECRATLTACRCLCQ